MSKNRSEIIQEIRDWNGMLSNVQNIPLNPNYKYNDENDLYERLNAHVKGFVEGVFGVYVTAEGEFRDVPDEQQNEVTKDFMKAIRGNVTPLENDWFEAALSGGKIGRMLPKIKEIGADPLQDALKGGQVDPQAAANAQQKAEQEKKRISNNVRYEINNAFFPAYRALRDSFSKRWWFEWIFNHKQYVAERDALKVMTNLITSIGGYTKAELNAEYKANKTMITAEEINPALRKKQPKPETVKENKVEKAPEKAPEPQTMLGKFEKLDGDEKGFFQQIIRDLGKAMHGVGVNVSAREKSIPFHIYAPLSKHAKNFCKVFDEYESVRGSDPDKFKAEIIEKGRETAEKMFISAFKALGTVDPVTKNLVFGEMSLKDRIMVAQKVTDLMLNKLTPVGFDSKNFANVAKGSFTLDNANSVRELAKAEGAGKYSDEAIDAALNAARKDLGALYRDERAERPNVYEIKYRPNPNDLKLEAKAISEALKLVNGQNPAINDPALKAIINENARKIKDVQAEKGGVITGAIRDKREADWSKNDDTLSKTYPDYDPKAIEKLINEIVAQKGAENNAPEKVSIDLNEPKAQVVPPVEKNPVEKAPPKIEK